MLNTIGVFIVALIGGFAGGAAKHFFDVLGRSAQRKLASKDELARLVIANLGELRALSIDYWSQDESDDIKPLGSRIVALCDSFPELYMMVLGKDVEAKRGLDTKFNRLATEITGGTFQQRDRKKDLLVITSIESELIAFETAFRIEVAKLPAPWF